MSFTVGVVGGGAAGLVAAGFAAKNGNKVLLFEGNAKVGRKIVITGKGRCNVTNNCDTDTFMTNVPQNSRFLFSAIRSFDPQSVMEFFEELGAPLKTERGNRVFPASDSSLDVVDALFKFVRQNKVEIINELVTDITAEDEEVQSVVTEHKTYKVDKIILATGGVSYPGTGSKGDGYKFAQKLGHTIIKPRASLVPMCAEGKMCPRLQGLSLKNISLSVYENDKKIYEDFGEMMFAHFGITGPVVLSASAHMRNFDTKKYKVLIDLKPALDHHVLDKRILSDFSEQLNLDFKNALNKLLPKKLIPIIVELSEIPPNTKVNSITKAQREKLVNILKALPVFITEPRPIAEAIITSGGVSTKEISPKTMESKLIKGLYFAGEIIDVDAYTGGFNLQIAWSTGYQAGNAI